MKNNMEKILTVLLTSVVISVTVLLLLVGVRGVHSLTRALVDLSYLGAFLAGLLGTSSLMISFFPPQIVAFLMRGKGIREFRQLASASLHTVMPFLAASASDQMLSIRLDILDPASLVRWGGVIGIAVIIFVETGLLFGFVFPGDSLLIAAGMLAEEGYLDLRSLLVLATVAAITGDQVNYAIGFRLGNTLSRRYAQFSKYLARAEAFYDRHGGKTIALARFVPVVRTFAPAVAGAVKMNYRSFTGYNIVGGILWVFSMTLAGYSLGKIPDVEKYLLVIVVIVVIASLMPQIFEWRKMRNDCPQNGKGRQG